MKPEDCYEGQGVVYRPYPDAPAEDGTVVRVGATGLVFVRYGAAVKATYAADLEPLWFTRPESS